MITLTTRTKRTIIINETNIEAVYPGESGPNYQKLLMLSGNTFEVLESMEEIYSKIKKELNDAKSS